jgi:hypothetical protein
MQAAVMKLDAREELLQYRDKIAECGVLCVVSPLRKVAAGVGCVGHSKDLSRVRMMLYETHPARLLMMLLAAMRSERYIQCEPGNCPSYEASMYVPVFLGCCPGCCPSNVCTYICSR